MQGFIENSGRAALIRQRDAPGALQLQAKAAAQEQSSAECRAQSENLEARPQAAS